MVWSLLLTAALADPQTSSHEAQQANIRLWHERSARAAAVSPTGLPGCAQALGEPTTEKAFRTALDRTSPNTRCVGVKGEVALLNPTVSTAPRYAPGLLPWDPPETAAVPCEVDYGPCLDEKGVLHVPSSALLTEIHTPTRLDRETRMAFRDAELSEATVHVRILVNEKGEVVEAVVVDGPEVAHALALSTIETWVFQPVISDGLARTVRSDLELTFRIR